MHRPTLRRVAPLLALLLLAACGGSPDFDARAPDVPFVDQLNPAGKDAFYDGSMNCGPAVLAGIAKGQGRSGGLNDASLINEFAYVTGTSLQGTTGHGMIAGLGLLGMNSDAVAGADLDWIDDELLAGHDVIANGDYYSVPGREDSTRHSGHYIAITAVGNNWSIYRVMDPASSQVTSMTDAQLVKFITSHPMGGFTISAW